MKWMNLCLYGTPQAYILTNRSNVRSLKKKQQNYCIWDFVCEICWGRISLGPANRSNSKIVLCNISQFLSTCTLFSFSTFRCVQESCLFPSLCFLCIKSIFDFFSSWESSIHSKQPRRSSFFWSQKKKLTLFCDYFVCVCFSRWSIHFFQRCNFPRICIQTKWFNSFTFLFVLLCKIFQWKHVNENSTPFWKKRTPAQFSTYHPTYRSPL